MVASISNRLKSRGQPVDGAEQSLPYLHQWLSYVATVAGAILSLIGTVAAIYAARKAKGAKDAAVEAQRAALRLGRIAQIGDLIGDMQELDPMIAREDFAAISQKCTRLIGRIADSSRRRTLNYQKLARSIWTRRAHNWRALGKLRQSVEVSPRTEWDASGSATRTQTSR
jgi:hypothetical protein